MTGESSRLARAARMAAASGNLQEAEKLYQHLLEISPAHIGALTFLSFIAKGRGDLDASREFLLQALRADQVNSVLWRNLGILDTAMGNHESARKSFEKSMELEPAAAINHLYLANTLEALGLLEPAVRHYQVAQQLDPELETATQNPEVTRMASQMTGARSKLHAEYHDNVFAELADQYPEHELARVSRFISMHHRRTAVEFSHPMQRPAFQYFPDLEPKPWFDPRDFDWTETAELAAEAVRDELLAIFDDESVLSPYVAHKGKVPDEWRALTNSTDWSAYHIYKEGERVEDHCAQCPATTALLEKLPLVTMPGQAPEAFFSILRPGTHIPPHYGLANLKLAVHLPLVIPGDCGIRVGDEVREWDPGRCLIFDDSFEHEAWNNSQESRAVLIFEVWNPQLTEIEKLAMSQLTAATVRFHALCKAAAEQAGPATFGN